MMIKKVILKSTEFTSNLAKNHLRKWFFEVLERDILYKDDLSLSWEEKVGGA